MKTLRIGCIKYLNAHPLIHGWPGSVLFDHPAVLCQTLARGDLDLALVSSIEYLRRPQYRIVDGVAIAAFGAVYSVVVAHQQQLSSAGEIEIDPASETSVALLRCLLAHHGCNPRLRSAPSQSSPGNTGQAPVLLIGDQAIRFRELHPQYQFFDLAQEWKNITHLPFVFALWLARPEMAGGCRTADLLRTLRDNNLQHLEELIASRSDFRPEFCRSYFRENLHFDFGEQEKTGLREFHRRSLACGIDVAPTFDLNVV